MLCLRNILVLNKFNHHKIFFLIIQANSYINQYQNNKYDMNKIKFPTKVTKINSSTKPIYQNNNGLSKIDNA